MVRNEYERLRQRDLAASESRYRGIFDIAVDAILIHDKGHVVEVNPAFKQLFGMTLEDIQQWKMLAQIKPDPRHILNTPELMNGEKQYHFEVTQPNGTVIPVEVYAKPINFDEREMRLVVVRDVRLTREAEQRRLELSIAKERTQLLEEFISNLSHDLRTPLNVMRTTIAITEMTDDEVEKRDNMEMLKRQIDHFERLFKQILTISRLDYAPQKDFNPVDVNKLLEILVQRMESEMKRRMIQTNLDLTPNLPIVMGDATSLQRAFTNLVENSINYSPKGSIVGVKTTIDGQHLTITFTDNGSGIDPEDLPHVFDRFYRGQKSRQQVGTGTGLGLAIVKGIVELHKGMIDISSTPDIGTTIRIRLPVIESVVHV